MIVVKRNWFGKASSSMLLAALCGATLLANAQTKTAAKHAAATPKTAATVRYVLVPAKSKIQFFVSSSLSDINGTFKTWTGQFKIPTQGSLVGISLKLQIDANSMTSGSDMKDKVIKGKDFFAVEQYPSVTFVSTKVTATSDPLKFEVLGDFTLRGVTKPVTLEVKLNQEKTIQGVIHGNLSFDRRDFGMTKNMPFNKVADTVKVQLDVDIEQAK